MLAQVLKQRLALTGFSDGKHLVHRWGVDPVAALPEVLRMAVGQVGLVPFTPSALSARTYSVSVLALPSRGWRSLMCSMVNMTDEAFGSQSSLFRPCARCARRRNP